jgi:hypothetical protein
MMESFKIYTYENNVFLFYNSPICDEPQLQVGSTCIPSIFLFVMCK